MSDIFHEVEEEVRRERFEKLWKKYGDYAIAAVAVIVIGIAGYKFWQRYEMQQQMNASHNFNAAQQALGAGNGAAAAASLADLAKSAPGGYVTMARLAEADALYVSGKPGEAITLYKTSLQRTILRLPVWPASAPPGRQWVPHRRPRSKRCSRL